MSCINCKHWDRVGDSETFMTVDDDGDCIEVDTKAHRCLRIIHFNAETREQCMKEEAFSTDTDQYHGALFTKESFSCSLWELLS